MTRQFFIKPILRGTCTGICVVTLGAIAYAQYGTDRYQRMDDNNDGVISRSEWRGSDQSFRRHDWNNDGVLSGDEVRAGARRRDNINDDNAWRGRSEVSEWTPQEFERLDDNRDGVVSQTEWQFDENTFRRVDRNDDGVISEREFLGEDDYNDEPSYGDERDNSTYRAGEQRGLTDGRQAGREDKVRRNAWDLDGQRELEQADAGYRSTLGPREDYQAGYRDGFVRGYREGFGPR
jgi:Ca2+-binding EF-hand superfamily protein